MPPVAKQIEFVLLVIAVILAVGSLVVLCLGAYWNWRSRRKVNAIMAEWIDKDVFSNEQVRVVGYRVENGKVVGLKVVDANGTRLD